MSRGQARQAERVVAGGGVRRLTRRASGRGKAGRTGRSRIDFSRQLCLRCFRVRFPQGCALAVASDGGRDDRGEGELTKAAAVLVLVLVLGARGHGNDGVVASSSMARAGEEGARKLEPSTDGCVLWTRGAPTRTILARKV